MAIRCTDFGVKSWFASNPRNYASINVRIFTIRCSSGAAATAVGTTLIFSSPFFFLFIPMVKFSFFMIEWRCFAPEEIGGNKFQCHIHFLIWKIGLTFFFLFQISVCLVLLFIYILITSFIDSNIIILTTGWTLKALNW